jgi:site-specific recombinase XerD
MGFREIAFLAVEHLPRPTWQQSAGFDRLYPSHCIRHSAVTNVYRQTRDLFLAQRFARHVSPLTTTVYTHPSDEELQTRLRGLHC